MALGEIQTALNGGELSPKLYARTDLAKFEAGAALLRNFIVDFRGGVANRPGTQFIAQVKDVAGAKRLIPFIVSTDAAYVLEFGDLYIRVYLTGVFVTEVVTPYLAADLALLKFTQSADVLTLVHPSYPPANFSRTSTTTFSYALIAVGPGIDPPVVTTMVAPHSGPYSFGYLVTAVDLDGKEESLPSNPAVKHSEGMNETTNRVIGLSWTPPAQGVSRYNIYKWGPIDSVTMNPATVWGFIGTAQTNTFTDNNIAPDFSKQPPGWGDPFSGGQLQSIVCTNGGAGYDGVSGDWPTAVPYVPLVITGDGTGAAGYAVIDHATGKIIGAYLTNPGKNYTNATITANGQGGTGATFSVTFSELAPLYPACTAYVQQRRVFAGSDPKPETLVMSQIGRYNNFNTTPVSLATDAIPFSIAGEQVNSIKSMAGVSYGLLLFTTSEVHLLNGGSPYASITTESVSVQSQSSVGANDLQPLRVNADVLYTQNKGNRVRNLSFAWQKQAFQGSDISALAAHLFDGFLTTEWTWAEEPFKLAWLVRDDGKMVSLTYAPDQEVAAWCRHDTQGRFKSVCSIPEGDDNEVYVIVERYVPANNLTPSDPSGNWVQYIERFAQRQGCCIFDAWFLDCALSLAKPAPANNLFLSGTTGAVTLTSSTTSSGPLTPTLTGIRDFDPVNITHMRPQQASVDWTTGKLAVSSPFDGMVVIYNINTFGYVLAPTAYVTTFDDGCFFGRDDFLYGVQGQTLYKCDPTTAAVLSSFGAGAGTGHTDNTHWAQPSTYDSIEFGGTSYLVSTSIQFNITGNEIAVLNLSAMAWTGTNFNIADNTRNAAVVTGGPATVWVLAGSNTNNSEGATSLGLYEISFGVGITNAKLASIPAASFGPGWTHVNTIQGLIYDQTDGNIIACVSTVPATAWNSANTYVLNDLVSAGGHEYISINAANLNNDPTISPLFWTDLGPTGPTDNRMVKVNVSTHAVVWGISFLSPVQSSLGRMGDTVIKRGQICYFDSSPPQQAFYAINTLTGTFVKTTVLGVTPEGGYFFSNDDLGLFFTFADYVQAAGTPAPIGGAPTSWSSAWTSFAPAGPPAVVGAFTVPGQVVQIGCGKIDITAVTNSFTAVGTVIAPLDITIPDDPNDTPLYIPSGNWTLTTPVSTISGLGHLEGKQVWALADGVVEGPFTVTGGALSAPLTNPATNIVVGLKYTQQIQTLYLTMDDLQPGSIQGKRKFIPSVVLRLDCTKGIEVGQDFDNLTPVPDCGDIDTNFVGLNPGELFAGDAFVNIGATWDDKGEICIQQNHPLPVAVLGIIVQVVPGDTGR
jgi:hypothetical protein